MTQTEAQLEESLIKRLGNLGYARVQISSSEELTANLKQQLETHNGVTLSSEEFSKVLIHLDSGNVFKRAKTLRDRMNLSRDDGSSVWLQFLNTDHWCQNQYQVTHQITQVGKYENRYDVTLLVNGLPLVQIELKKRGLEIKEAFNQINRYQRHSYWADDGLFQYVQLFVISNGVNTKYFANNRKQDFKQTFYWANIDNKLITQLDDFADVFLEKCHVSKMICKYIVLHHSDKILMVLRPYQYYAAELIEERVKNTRKNGYIWHTTGSGKTLTSFKAAQLLTALPVVHKVVFVVDRADLDYQTSKEFNYFSTGCVDETNSTKELVKQISGSNSLVLTTIQKLNNAIQKDKYESAMADLKDKRVVFIFDECHRSQFGDTHKRITEFFSESQLFGFTGTPILEKNSSRNDLGKRTTKDLFDKCLHRYLITNAIADQNVLKFAVEYWGKLKRKDGSLIDEPVSSINIKEFFENQERIENVVDWVITNHSHKTHGKTFSAMMCVGSVNALKKYYDTFKAKKEAGEHDLRVITIFSYGANEEDADANGEIPDEELDPKADNLSSKHSREVLEAYVGDYNQLYKTKQSVKDGKSFYTYYKDIAKRLKDRNKEGFQDKDRVDILLVVNMFLTGFDAKKLNTIYVDKNLKHHGLIQAFSRTNRTLGELKSQGNVVCFRNLKKATDEAIALFSDKDAKETVLVEPYDTHVELFNQGVLELKLIVATPNDVNELVSENDILAFVRAFRALMRLMNVIKTFTEFSWADLDLGEQAYLDYRSKYMDISDRAKKDGEGVSIIDEVDFELELIHRDEINVAYILKLLASLLQQAKEYNESAVTDDNINCKTAEELAQEIEAQKAAILDLLGNESSLRSKRELIEKFINEYLPKLDTANDVQIVFADFWCAEKERAITELCDVESMSVEAAKKIIDEYHFTGKEPLRDTVFAAMETKPKVMERKKIFERIVAKLMDVIGRFDDGMGGL